MNFVFSRLNSRGAAIDKKIFRVEGAKATLEEGAELNEEMYVSIFKSWHKCI